MANMTKLTPEAVAFGAKMEAEKDEWPDELTEAATMLRLELEASRLKSWPVYGIGPKKLAEYHERFQRLYAEWKAVKDAAQP